MGNEYMMAFLAYTVFFIVGAASFIKILHISIQDGQWLDKLLKWQDRLHKWDLEGKEAIVKIGGLCEVCFSHFISFLTFWIYVFAMKSLGVWAISGIWMHLIWYVVYVSISTNAGVYFITKLFEKK